METILAIIFVVFGVLQIILFFKVWSMTDDVKSIKNILSSNDLKAKAQILVLKGEMPEAKNVLDESFLFELTKYESKKYDNYYDYYDEITAEYKEIYESLGLAPLDFEKMREKSFEILG